MQNFKNLTKTVSERNRIKRKSKNKKRKSRKSDREVFGKSANALISDFAITVFPKEISTEGHNNPL